MNSTDTIKKKLVLYKPVLTEKYRVKEIGIFGSYVRGEQKQKSDLDLLVDFTESISLLDFIHLENELSVLLGVKVDLVMKNALKPRIGKHILEEVVCV
jgi:predicted nucleotidyltransferase